MRKRNKKPLISVCITAYNIADFLDEALASVLNQKGDFDLEILIAEDKSTDSTLRIALDWQDKYPDKIHVFPAESNRGLMNNYLFVLKKAKGDYVALLDGDDFWTDPFKLQKQLDILIASPKVMLTWHNAIMQSQNGERISSYAARYKGRTYLKGVSLKQIVQWRVLGATSSIFMRNLFSEIPSWFTAMGGPEPSLFLLAKINGEVLYLDESFSVYRIHGKSIEHRLTKISKSQRNIRESKALLINFFPISFIGLIRRILWNYVYVLLLKGKLKL